MSDLSACAMRDSKVLNMSKDARESSLEYIRCPLCDAASQWPEQLAIVASDRSLTYGELDQLVEGTANRLLKKGIGREEHVGIYLAPSWQYIVLFLALVRAEALAVLLSTRLPLDGLEALLKKTEVSAVISQESKKLIEMTEGLKVYSSDELVASATAQPSLELAKDRLVTMVFTSGSTGTPKAAVHSFGNHYYSAVGSNENIQLQPGDRWLLALPLYHVGGIGILYRCLLAGATIVLQPSNCTLGETIGEYKITHLSLVPTQLGRLLQEEGAYSCLRAILVGGSAVSSRLVLEAFEAGLPLYTTYGMTEMSSQVTTTPPGATLQQLFTSGRLLPHRDIRLTEDGVILVRGETLFKGYWERGTPVSSCDEEGWFRTSDLGKWTDEGFLRVLGRIDYMFISGGENIHPEEIEQALLRIDGIEAAIVVPVEDREFGFRPVAVLKYIQDTVPETFISEFLSRTLPRFKMPIMYYDWPQDESHSGLKVDRRSLQRYVERLRRIAF